MTVRMSVDVGGTFTDLVAYDSSRHEWTVAKIPTTPANPSIGVLAAVDEVADKVDLGAIDYFIHGTTVGLNAVLERRGSVVGLITTGGFRDVLELRRSDRESPYDLFWRQPDALVPRRLRREVSERMSAGGVELRPLVQAEVEGAVTELVELKATSIAVCFMNAYANPEHERAAAEVIRSCGFDGAISLSHVVSSEYREYERFSTAVVDAFVKGRMADYLDQLAAGLRSRGVAGELLCSRSGGGALTFAEAAARPFETLLSGPVGAPAGGAHMPLGELGDELVTADVGGTSFDTCLVVDGKPQVMYQGSIGGWPILSEWVDVRSIGAGGGSIARADHGLLKVGPESAGADPGPAAYGRGGSQPTVTDAATRLGMLGPGNLAGGVNLDVAAAERALAGPASQLDLTTEETAAGIIRIAASSMANAIREITIEEGRDPRPMVLLPVGGAGPLLASPLADELGMSAFVVPLFAGNFSAYGLLTADIVETRALTRIVPVSEDGLTEAANAAASVFDELRPSHGQSTTGAIAAEDSLTLDLRYVGQEHSLNLEVGWDNGRLSLSPEALRHDFEIAYKTAFGITLEQDVEVVSLRPRRRWPLEAQTLPAIQRAGTTEPEPVASWRAFSFTAGEWREFKVYRREDLRASHIVPGPAIVTEHTTTTYIDAGFTATISTEGLMIVRKDS